ncbi:MAG: 3-dehydroquinate synthase family protein [Candidatus Methanomethylophilaceae archaeon]|jgi:3-dehydroquinate synthase
MKIKSYAGEYSVSFTDSLEFLQDLGKADNRFTVADRNIAEKYADKLGSLLDGSHFILDAAEENKTVGTALKIAEKMFPMESKRNTVLISVGGGIVQDVCCFVSTILYRGIRWYFVPTTLLSQTDSCIGSKSSINYGGYKNIFGTFYPPSKIIVSSAFLDTLSAREFRSGLGEIAKIAIMRGRPAFEEFASVLDGILAGDRTALTAEIRNTLSYKKILIEEDEFDRGIRNLLNYGHTFGHALESASGYAVPHGQAVSAGILMANSVSVSRGILSQEYSDGIAEVLIKIIDTESLKKEFFEPGGFIKK